MCIHIPWYKSQWTRISKYKRVNNEESMVFVSCICSCCFLHSFYQFYYSYSKHILLCGFILNYGNAVVCGTVNILWITYHKTRWCCGYNTKLYLVVRLQLWTSGECRVLHWYYSHYHSDTVVVPIRVPSMDQIDMFEIWPCWLGLECYNIQWEKASFNTRQTRNI